MKYLFVATILLFSFCSVAQVAREARPYDSTAKWVRGLKIIDLIECKHIFIAVEPDTVTLTRGSVSILTYPEQGKDIVCVKCFYQTKQKIKHVNPNPLPTWQILPKDFFTQH